MFVSRGLKDTKIKIKPISSHHNFMVVILNTPPPIWIQSTFTILNHAKNSSNNLTVKARCNLEASRWYYLVSWTCPTSSVWRGIHLQCWWRRWRQLLRPGPGRCWRDTDHLPSTIGLPQPWYQRWHWSQTSGENEGLGSHPIQCGNLWTNTIQLTQQGICKSSFCICYRWYCNFQPLL